MDTTRRSKTSTNQNYNRRKECLLSVSGSCIGQTTSLFLFVVSLHQRCAAAAAVSDLLPSSEQSPTTLNNNNINNNNKNNNNNQKTFPLHPTTTKSRRGALFGFFCSLRNNHRTPHNNNSAVDCFPFSLAIPFHFITNQQQE